jgi:hypothetical protein
LKAALEDAHGQIATLTIEKDQDAKAFALAAASSRKSEEALRQAAQDAHSLATHRESELQELQRQLKSAAAENRSMVACINHNVAIATNANHQLSASQRETAQAQAQTIILGARLRAFEAKPDTSSAAGHTETSHGNTPREDRQP